jgi:hypothetical protein
MKNRRGGLLTLLAMGVGVGRSTSSLGDSIIHERACHEIFQDSENIDS